MATGDKLITLDELKLVHDAKLDKSKVANNTTTTASGYALDARQGKALADAIAPGGNVSSGDLNDFTTPGKVYYLLVSGTFTNHPAPGVPTQLFVISHVTTSNPQYISQIAITSESVFFRRKFSSAGTTWTAWMRFQMSSGGWKTNGPDLDDLIYPGTYGVAGGSTDKHFPTGVTGGVLTVVNPGPSGSYCLQRLETGPTIYTRYRGESSGTSFGQWMRFSGVQRGHMSDADASVPTGTYYDFSVTFTLPFASAPTVVVSNNGGPVTQSMENGKINYTVISTSTTGFTVRMFNNASFARTPDFNWIAVQ